MPTPSPVTFITGAGSGIGRAIAVAASGKGHRTVLCGRREAALRETASVLSAESLCIPTDVAVPAQVRSAVAQAVRHFGRLDTVVNNAGLGRVIPIADTTPELMEETLRVNTLSAAAAIHAAWPVFASQRRGCIINISSMATYDPFPGFFAYAASKAALNLMATSAAKEGAELGVRAFAIAPGAVETPMLRASFDEEKLPRSQCLRAEQVALLVMDCIEGRRDRDNGRTIPIVPDAARAWLESWARDHAPLTK